MDDLLKVLEKISTLYGPIYGIIFFVILFVLFLILYFFQKRISNISEEISSKAIAEFSKKLDLVFRDESIRTNLRYKTAQKSVDKKLEYYEKVYEMYFTSQGLLFNTDYRAYDQILGQLLKLREDLFLNSIYLGDYLSKKLIRSVNLLFSSVRSKSHPYKFPKSTSEVDKVDYIELYSSVMDEAKKWLIENIYPHQTVSEFEFTQEQSDNIKEEKDKYLKDLKNFG